MTVTTVTKKQETAKNERAAMIMTTVMLAPNQMWCQGVKREKNKTEKPQAKRRKRQKQTPPKG